MELDYLEKLGKIQIPTLIVVGEEDPGTPVSAARDIQERIVDSKLVILPGARHLSSVEQAGAFNQAVLEFSIYLIFCSVALASSPPENLGSSSSARFNSARARSFWLFLK